MKLTEEIKSLLNGERIDQEAALRLMLVSQAEILERLSRVEGLANGSTDYQRLYPSLMWYWIHRRKTLIIVTIAIFLTLYFLLTPITLFEIRSVLLNTLGVPVSVPIIVPTPGP